MNQRTLIFGEYKTKFHFIEDLIIQFGRTRRINHTFYENCVVRQSSKKCNAASLLKILGTPALGSRLLPVIF